MWPWWVVIPIQDLTVILAIENTVRMIEDEEDEEEEEEEEKEEGVFRQLVSLKNKGCMDL